MVEFDREHVSSHQDQVTAFRQPFGLAMKAKTLGHHLHLHAPRRAAPLRAAFANLCERANAAPTAAPRQQLLNPSNFLTPSLVF